MPVPRTTRQSRQILWSALSKRFDAWNKATDDELRAEVQSLMPGITVHDATRTELLKFLVMDHTDKMIP